MSAISAAAPWLNVPESGLPIDFAAAAVARSITCSSGWPSFRSFDNVAIMFPVSGEPGVPAVGTAVVTPFGRRW